MERRNFMAGTAGLGLVYGLHAMGLGAQGRAGESKRAAKDERFPGYLGDAIAAMQASGRGAVVFVLPEAAKPREKVLMSLHGLVQGRQLRYEPEESAQLARCGAKEQRARYDAWRDDCQRVLSAAVVICLTRADAERYFAAGERQSMIVLDPKARVIARHVVPDGKSFVEPRPKLLWNAILGPDGKHLRRIAKSARQLLGRDSLALLDRSFERLRAADSRREVSDVHANVREIAGRITAICRERAHRSGDETFEKRLTPLCEHHARVYEKRLPFGSTLPPKPKIPPCPACGMAIMKPKALRFVGKLR